MNGLCRANLVELLALSMCVCVFHVNGKYNTQPMVVLIQQMESCSLICKTAFAVPPPRHFSQLVCLWARQSKKPGLYF